MSPRAWVAGAVKARRVIGALAGTFVLCVTAWVPLSAFVSRHIAPPERVEAVEGRIGTVEARVGALEASQDRTSRGVEFLVCRDQRREARLPLDYCDPYWQAESFLPPAREP